MLEWLRRSRNLFGVLLVALTTPLLAEDGPRTFARFADDGFFYPCTIEKEQDGQILVRYSAGSTALVPKWGLANCDVKVGDSVYANWQNKGRFYSARVAQRDGDELRLHYDDGDIEHTTIARIRGKIPVNAQQVGCPVMARWDPDGHWYPGVVKEVRDNQCLVRFDDGTETWREVKHVFGYQPTWNDVVQGNWLGRGKYYVARIGQRKKNQVLLLYEDGDEEWTTMSRLRADYGLVAPKTIEVVPED